MKRFMFIPVVLIPMLVMAQGYTGQHEVEQLGSGVYPSEATYTNADIQAAIEAYPVDEQGKGFVTLVTTRGCAACQSLKACLDADPNWQSLIRSGKFHVNVYDATTRTGKAHIDRLRAGGMQINSYPTLIVQSSKQTGYQVISQETGYNGQCRGVVVRTLGRIVQFVRKVLPPYPNRFPRPKPSPGPAPAPGPFPVPPAPVLVPPVMVPPQPIVQWPPEPVSQPVAGGFRPHAVLITDPDGIAEKLKERVGRGVLKLLAKRYDLDVKMYVERYSEEVAQKHGITRDLVPCVLIYEGDQKVMFASSRLLDVMNNSELSVDEVDPEPSVVGKVGQVVSTAVDTAGYPLSIVIGATIISVLTGGGLFGGLAWMWNRNPVRLANGLRKRIAKRREKADKEEEALKELTAVPKSKK